LIVFNISIILIHQIILRFKFFQNFNFERTSLDLDAKASLEAVFVNPISSNHRSPAEF
jgi:hypothetical protein